MTTVRDYYKKDTPNGICVPSINNAQECGFAEKKLITNNTEKFRIMSEFGVIPSSEEAHDFLIEYPVFILEAGTVVCHSTQIRRALKITEDYDFKILR
jgi:hypothetical protein